MNNPMASLQSREPLLWLKSMRANVLHGTSLPKIDFKTCDDVIKGFTVWDQTPVIGQDGAPFRIDNADLWLFLCAPNTIIGDDRHKRNRLRLVIRLDGQWLDCGYLFPDAFSFGSREWAGMAICDGEHIEVFYTAAGCQGDMGEGVIQRLCYAKAKLDYSNDYASCTDWSDHIEIVVPDGIAYRYSDAEPRTSGAICAFRDPFVFDDSLTKERSLVFAATKENSTSRFDACIGLATFSKSQQQWRLDAPLLDAEGVSFEVERPHIVKQGSNYYLFWSMHGWTSEELLNLPTGLYGAVSESVRGPYRLLNGSGLVAANPTEQPYQAYSWFVSPDLRVSSFIDLPNGRQSGDTLNPKKPHGTFVGKFAHEFDLWIDGDTAKPMCRGQQHPIAC